tara:strand:+ start:535 stop:909 length:375 start_codon:yes stop_codon:yes gene_type:complete
MNNINHFDEYLGIGANEPQEYDFTVINLDSNSPQVETPTDIPLECAPINPYDKTIITKKSNSLGRERKTYSVSGELALRIKLLATLKTKECKLYGVGKRCTESQLLEEGMRYVLKKNRQKHKSG